MIINVYFKSKKKEAIMPINIKWKIGFKKISSPDFIKSLTSVLL